MSREMTSYSFNNVAAYVNGVLVEGLWEGDDVVMVEPAADTAVPSVGADGKAIVSVTMNIAANITLKLQPTSPTHQELLRLHASIRDGSFKPFTFSVMDTGSAEGGSAQQCTIMRRPNMQVGNAASVREWKLFAGAWVENNTSFL